jgi:DNA-binding response OmpR family regulator
MYVIIDDRKTVANSYVTSLKREGVASIGFSSEEFMEWLGLASGSDLSAIDGLLLGDCSIRTTLPNEVRKRCGAPIIALSNLRMLEDTIALFDAGVDDVVQVPTHLREILARTAAIGRHICTQWENAIQVFFNGKDPEVGGSPLRLPRRELRVLEYMAIHQGKWLTKTQIFNAVYGIFESTVDENVIESHVSKLRRKLRARLGYDPIMSKRYLGYRLDPSLRNPIDQKQILRPHRSAVGPAALGSKPALS